MQDMKVILENEWQQFNERQDNESLFKEVNSPAHYADKDIEVIDYIVDTVADPRSYCVGNVIKYVSRYDRKEDALKDLLKAEYYLKKTIELLRKEADNS